MPLRSGSGPPTLPPLSLTPVCLFCHPRVQRALSRSRGPGARAQPKGWALWREGDSGPQKSRLGDSRFSSPPPLFRGQRCVQSFSRGGQEGSKGCLILPPFRLFIWGGGGGLSQAVSRTAGTVLPPPASSQSSSTSRCLLGTPKLPTQLASHSPPTPHWGPFLALPNTFQLPAVPLERERGRRKGWLELPLPPVSQTLAQRPWR